MIIPPLIIFAMAAGMEGLENIDSVTMLLIGPALLGLCLGIGPVLVGMPKLVVGRRRPTIRFVGGLAMIVSIFTTGLLYRKLSIRT